MKYLLPLLFGVLPLTAASQYDWRLKKESDGIQLYWSAVNGTNFVATKTVTQIKTTLPQLISLFKDIDQYPTLFAATEEARLLEQVGELKQYHYIESRAPWPISNRDGIYLFEYDYNAALQTAYIRLKCLPDYLPEEKGIVRIPRCEGAWTFKKIDASTVQVSCVFFVELGGNLPAWAVNLSAVDLPMKIVRNVRETVNLPKYKNQHYSFLDN